MTRNQDPELCKCELLRTLFLRPFWEYAGSPRHCRFFKMNVLCRIIKCSTAKHILVLEAFKNIMRECCCMDLSCYLVANGLENTAAWNPDHCCYYVRDAGLKWLLTSSEKGKRWMIVDDMKYQALASWFPFEWHFGGGGQLLARSSRRLFQSLTQSPTKIYGDSVGKGTMLIKKSLQRYSVIFVGNGQ